MSNEIAIPYVGPETPYALARSESGQALNGSGWTTWVDGDLAAYARALSDLEGDLWGRNLPSGISSGTAFWLTYHEPVGGSAALSDLVLRSERVRWNGSSLDPPFARLRSLSSSRLFFPYVWTRAVYAVLRLPNGQVWNGSAWASWSDVDLATYAISLPALGGNMVGAPLPAGISGSTRIWAFCREQAGGAPALDDLLMDTALVMPPLDLSAVATDGFWGPIKRLEALVASSEAFQAWVNVDNATEALARVHVVGEDFANVTRPFAVVSWGDEFGASKIAGGSRDYYRYEGSLWLRFESDVEDDDADSLEDAGRSHLATVGEVVSEMLAEAGGPNGHLSVRRLGSAGLPQRNEESITGEEGDFIVSSWSVQREH